MGAVPSGRQSCLGAGRGAVPRFLGNIQPGAKSPECGTNVVSKSCQSHCTLHTAESSAHKNDCLLLFKKGD